MKGIKSAAFLCLVFLLSLAGFSAAESSGNISISGNFSKGYTVNNWYSSSVSVSGGFQDYTFRITSGDIPAGFFIRQDGANFWLEGIPHNAGTWDFTLRIIDSHGNFTEQDFSVTFDAESFESDDIDIFTSYATTGQAGTWYQGKIRAERGVPGYTCIVDGQLPAGLYIGQAGNEFYFEGVPVQAGDNTFVIRIFDRRNLYAEESITLSISEGEYTEPSKSDDITISGDIPSLWRVNDEYSGYADIYGLDDDTGWPVYWSVTDGTLPPGITLGAPSYSSTLYFGGIPSAAGTYTFTLRAVDGRNKYAEREFTVKISDTPCESDDLSISGSFFSQRMTGSYFRSDNVSLEGFSNSGLSVLWSVVSGEIPPGLSIVPLLSLNSAGAYLAGIPNTGGTYSFTLRATDIRNAYAERDFTVKINDSPYQAEDMSITGDIAPETRINGNYSSSVSLEGFDGSGSSVRWHVVSGEIPPGISLIPSSSYGTASVAFSGIPNTAGTFTFTLRAYDIRNAYAEQKFSLKVNDVPYKADDMTITGTVSPSHTVNAACSERITLSGFYGSWKNVHLSVVSGEIPPGVSLYPSFAGDIFIGGTPRSTGTFTFTLRAYDSRNAYTDREITMNVTGEAQEISPAEDISLSGEFPDGYTVNDWYSESITASGGTSHYTFSVSDGSIPPGFYLRLSGSQCFLEGIPNTPGTYTFTVRAVDDNKTYADKEFTVNIKSETYAADDITLSGNFPDAYTASAWYSERIQIDGGTPGYTFSITEGSLPAGFYIRNEGGYFFLDGIPGGTGTYTFTLRVTDRRNSYAERAFTVSVKDSDSESDSVSITANSLPPAGVGLRYSQKVTAQGNPSSWSITSGALPEGLTVSAVTGEISGAVSANAIEANARNPKHYTFDVTASNSAGNSDTKTLTIDVYEPAAIVTETLPSSKAGQSYDAQIEARGTYIHIWELKPSENVPSWLEKSNSTQHNICSLSGIPSEEGTYTFTAECGNSYFRASKDFTLTVEPADGIVSIRAESLDPAAAGQEYIRTITASGSPTSWSITSGNICPGLTLSGDGTICGVVSADAIPANSEAGKIYTFDITAANSTKSDTKTFSITVYEPVRIITESLPDGKEGEEYSAVIEAAGTRVDFSQALIPADDLPPGLEADISEKGRITISGTPSIKGTYSIRASFKNLWDKSEKVFILNVSGRSAQSIKPQITLPKNYSTLISGQSYSFNFTASGTQPVTWSIMGDIPDGLSFDTSSAALSGTAASLSSYSSAKKPKTYSFTVKASNSGGNDSAEVFMSVWYPPVISTAVNLPAASEDNSYSAQITAEGTESSMEWKKLSGRLPKGLTITMSGNNRTCTITGTPKATGTFLFSLNVSNYAGSSSKNFVLKVNADTSSETGAPTINTRSLPEGYTGEKYSALMEASGRKPITWSKSGTLPKGLKLDKYGTITGVPKSPGVYNFTVNAKNKDGTTKQNFTIRITGDSYSKPKITTKKIPEGTINESYSIQLECTGTSPLTWTLANSKYPAGLYITDDGKISGIPKEAGKFTVKVKAENSIGTSTKSFSLKINGIAPSILTDSLSSGLKGSEYSAQLLAEGTAPLTWSKSGKFPSGLKLNSKTGEITGKPKKTGTYSFTITAKNKYGKYSRTFAVIVSSSVSDSPEETETFPEMTENFTPYTPENFAQPEEYSQPETHGHESEIDLCVISGDEELRGEIYAPEGQPLTFQIGAWPAARYSDMEIFIADEAIAIDIDDDGTFTIPGELVCDEFVVYAEGGGEKTIELYIVAEPEE